MNSGLSKILRNEPFGEQVLDEHLIDGGAADVRD